MKCEHFRYLLPGTQIYPDNFKKKKEYRVRIVDGHETNIYNKPDGKVIEILRCGN